jgi:hypothetical protein
VGKTNTTGGECNFGMVQHVTIKAVDATSVTFAARSASKSGNANENLLRDFTVPLADVYAKPIPGAPALPVALVPGSTGALFLSRTGWATTTADGFGLFDADKAVFKWPDCAAMSAPPMTRLSVIPSSILLHGHVQGQASFFELELLGPEAADAQDLRWTGADFLDLRVTEAVANRLRVEPRATCVKVWPTRLVVKGAPAIDQAVSGEVDLLDTELAEAMQHIAFARRGAPITLSLTQDGVNAFHVTPQAVAEFASEAEAASVAHAQPVSAPHRTRIA